MRYRIKMPKAIPKNSKILKTILKNPITPENILKNLKIPNPTLKTVLKSIYCQSWPPKRNISGNIEPSRLKTRYSTLHLFMVFSLGASNWGHFTLNGVIR